MNLATGFNTALTPESPFAKPVLSSITWSRLFHVLATRPEIQDRLRQDIAGLAEQNPDPPFNEIDALPYLDNFVNEVLRVYPPG